MIRILSQPRSGHRDRLMALVGCTVVSLMLALGLVPLRTSAHVIPTGGVKVSCDDSVPNVAVTVTSWSGHILITRNTPPANAVSKVANGNVTVTFTIAELGGNGSYTVSRPEDTSGHDPTPVDFVINCTHPNLAISKTADADKVSAGSQIGFTVNVHNGGDAAATGVSVNDSLPSGNGISWSISPATAGCTVDGNPPSQALNCAFGDLDPDATRSVHVVSATAFASCATYDNTAKVSATNQGDVTSGKASTTVQCSNLSLTKSAGAEKVSAGSSIGFTINLHNGGEGTATNVNLSDSLPGGPGISWSIDPAVAGCAISGAVPTQALACAFGDLAKNASRSVHLVSGTAFASCATYDNSARVTADNQQGVDSNTASTTVECSELAISKTADNAKVDAGDQIGFTVTVHNGGKGTAKGVSVNDSLPAGPGISWSINPAVDGCAIDGDAPTQTLKCAFGDLAADAGKSVHVVSGTQFASCATYDNTAMVSATNQGDVTSETASTTVECSDQSLSKTADAASVSAGSAIGYTLKVSNAGPGAAHNVVLTDALPGGNGIDWSINPAVEGCSVTGTAPSQAVHCAFGDMAAGDSREVHVTSATTAQSCAKYDNSAVISADNSASMTSPTASTTVVCSEELPKQTVLGATTQPNTGHNDWSKGLGVAILLVLVGAAVFMAQAYFRPERQRS